MNLFKIFEDTELSIKENEFYNKIYSETKKIYSYLMKSINEFHQIFESNLLNFQDALDYLEKIYIPNNCVYAKVIVDIPG